MVGAYVVAFKVVHVKLLAHIAGYSRLTAACRPGNEPYVLGFGN